jgi:hypothetical protein
VIHLRKIRGTARFTQESTAQESIVSDWTVLGSQLCISNAVVPLQAAHTFPIGGMTHESDSSSNIRGSFVRLQWWRNQFSEGRTLCAVPKRPTTQRRRDLGPIRGRSHKSVTSGGQTFTEVLAPDGKASIEITGNPKATGSWKIAGDVICVTYSAYGEECSIVKADDQWFWFVDKVKGSTNNRFPR